MKFEWTVSRLQVHFLDVLVSLEIDPGIPATNPQFRLVTSVYQKALNAYLYIPWNSCHSPDSKRAWIKGELIRYVRICSKEANYARVQSEFMVRLRERGYPGIWLQRVFEEIKYKVEHPTALKPSAAHTDAGDPALHVLKLTHNPIWDDINLNPIWRELGETWSELRAGYPEFRFMASFKKPPALGDRLNTTKRHVELIPRFDGGTCLDLFFSILAHAPPGTLRVPAPDVALTRIDKKPTVLNSQCPPLMIGLTCSQNR
jgi:hypothetical protein